MLCQRREDDVDAELGEPTVEHGSVVVIVLWQGDLRALQFRYPFGPSSAPIEPLDPAKAEKGRVKDHRVRAWSVAATRVRPASRCRRGDDCGPGSRQSARR